MISPRIRILCRFAKMPLDINLFRENDGITRLKQSVRKRYRDEALIDQVTSLDKSYRAGEAWP